MRLATAGVAPNISTTPLSSWHCQTSSGARALPSAQSNIGARVSQNASSFDLETFQLLNVERLSKLENYLQRQVSNHMITQAASEVYRLAVFEFISNVGRTLGIPDALPGEDGDMKYHWRGNAYSVRLDIQPDGAAELYFLDKQRKDDFLVEYRVGKLSEKISFEPDLQLVMTG